jgi:xyloglucan-specific endo-beta-1,4-glucanase
MFTSSSASGSNAYEIMVWLAALGGAGPISSNGSPIVTPLSAA